MRRIGMVAVVLAMGLVGCSNSGGAGPTTNPAGGAATSGPTGATTSGDGATTGATSAPGTSSPAASSPAPTHSAKPPESPVPTESPVPVESNPPGDIPDSTQFVPYHSAAGGFEIQAPEGWARRTTSSQVTFNSNLNTIGLTWRATSTQPTAAAVKRSEIPGLAHSFRAFRLVSVQPVSLPGGSAVQVDFHVNSDPNPVTGKQYRMDVLRFDFFRGGREASLDLTSPVGSDNVDDWKLVSESFRWR